MRRDSTHLFHNWEYERHQLPLGAQERNHVIGPISSGGGVKRAAKKQAGQHASRHASKTQARTPQDEKEQHLVLIENEANVWFRAGFGAADCRFRFPGMKKKRTPEGASDLTSLKFVAEDFAFTKPPGLATKTAGVFATAAIEKRTRAVGGHGEGSLSTHQRKV